MVRKEVEVENMECQKVIEKKRILMEKKEKAQTRMMIVCEDLQMM